MKKLNKTTAPLADTTPTPEVTTPEVILSPAQKAWITRRAKNPNIGAEQAAKAWVTRRLNAALAGTAPVVAE